MDGFHAAQAATIEQFGNHLCGSVHERNYGSDFFACHNNGNMDLLIGANSIDALLHRMFEDAFVKENEGIHGLVLDGRSDVCVYCEVSQERFDFGFGGKKVFTGPHVVETNKPNDPVQIGSFGVDGVVVQTEYLSDLIVVDFLSNQAYKTPMVIARNS